MMQPTYEDAINAIREAQRLADISEEAHAVMPVDGGWAVKMLSLVDDLTYVVESCRPIYRRRYE